MVEFHTFYVDVFTIQIKLIFITILYIFDMIPTIYILVATYYSFLSHTKSLHIFKKLYASRYEAFETLLKRTFWGLKGEKMKPLFYIGKTYVMTRTEKTRFFLFFFSSWHWLFYRQMVLFWLRRKNLIWIDTNTKTIFP